MHISTKLSQNCETIPVNVLISMNQFAHQMDKLTQTIVISNAQITHSNIMVFARMTACVQLSRIQFVE